jgi:uncharacterized membrane protein
MSFIATIFVAVVGFLLVAGVFYLLRALVLKIRISDLDDAGKRKILEEELRSGEISPEECRRKKKDLEEE